MAVLTVLSLVGSLVMAIYKKHFKFWGLCVIIVFVLNILLSLALTNGRYWSNGSWSNNPKDYGFVGMLLTIAIHIVYWKAALTGTLKGMFDFKFVENGKCEEE